MDLVNKLNKRFPLRQAELKHLCISLVLMRDTDVCNASKEICCGCGLLDF